MKNIFSKSPGTDVRAQVSQSMPWNKDSVCSEMEDLCAKGVQFFLKRIIIIYFQEKVS